MTSPANRGMLMGPANKTRPTENTIPHHECEYGWCGTASNAGRTAHEYLDWPSGPPVRSRWFCSLGCMSRWAIREELRQP